MRNQKRGERKRNHKMHESKESLMYEAFEHQPQMHKIPKTTLKVRGK